MEYDQHIPAGRTPEQIAEDAEMAEITGELFELAQSVVDMREDKAA